jgi:hypothetical protein
MSRDVGLPVGATRFIDTDARLARRRFQGERNQRLAGPYQRYEGGLLAGRPLIPGAAIKGFRSGQDRMSAEAGEVSLGALQTRSPQRARRGRWGCADR